MNEPKTEEGEKTPHVSVSEWLSSPKALKIIVWAGLIGMALILVSSLWDSHRAAQTAAPASDDYAAVMEAKLQETLLCVNGVSDCRVLITLENGSRAVYAGGKELTECEPTVRGVVVVVQGVLDDTAETEVKNVVKTALHVTEKRVCVVTDMQNEY